MNVSRPALRYHGGKWLLAPWIIEHFPPHRIYVEPFGGAASVLLRKPRSYAEVYNDLWSDVVRVFRVLRDREHAAELERLLRLTPFARDEFRDAGNGGGGDDVEIARQTILRSFQGFGSAATNRRYATGFRSCSNRSGTTPAQDWRYYPDMIEAFVKRLQGVVIENKDALEVMAQHDTAETLHYVDPPYPNETRNRGGADPYVYEMSDEDHSQVLELLQSLNGMVVVSTYPNNLYERALAGWHKVERAHFADGARRRTEVLYLSPRTYERLPRLI